MKKICFFGGTFNPVHKGHINLVNEIKKTIEPDLVVVVPNGIPPHKALGASAFHRFEMVKNAFCKTENVLVSDYELKKETPSYTWETLTHFKEIYSDSEFFFIMGMDNLYDIKTWKHPEKICKLATLVFYGRDHFPKNENEVMFLKKNYNANILTFDFDFPCSSTNFRDKLLGGEDIFEDIDINEFDYILKNGLYSLECIKEYDFFENEVKKYVDEKRFIHSKGVAQTAYLLAKKYGEDCKKAYFAGLVHDIAKNFDYEKQLKFSKNIKLSKDEKEYKKMLHAPAGAGFLKENYGIKDKKVLNGVRFHTKGDPNMTLFDKIIYLADYVEPSRNYNGVKELRQAVFSDIEKGLLLSCDETLKMLVERKNKISPCLIELRNSIIEKQEK